MEKIGIYGGTFNPPHTGHIQGAAYALEKLGLTRLLMVPDYLAPHKEIPAGSATPEQRLSMLRLACKDKPGLEVCDLEMRRQGRSYTYETVVQLREAYRDAELTLLMGTDMFLSFDSWRKPESILQNAALAVMCRGDKGEREAIEAQKAKLEAMGAKIYVLKNPVVAISSSDLRRLIAFGCAGEFLDEAVADFIREHGLYGADANWKNLPMPELEKVVVPLMKEKRVAHILGCCQTAVELARLYGADETDAARAGLLHDITKALDGPLQLTLCRAYGTILDDFSRKNPKTLHALTGSLVAERVFGENEAVVSAIRYHTTSRANMTLLEKIIYVADYVEPNRDFPGVEKLRKAAYENIDQALKLGLESTLALLKEQGREVSPESGEALRYLLEHGV